MTDTVKPAEVRPYLILTYDRWIIFAIVLIGGWLLFRPIFAFAVYYRGVSFEHMLRLSVAEHYYRKAISVDPRIPEGWFGLGTLQAMRGRAQPADYAAALDTFTRGLAYNPKSGDLSFALCRAYVEIGKDYKNGLTACQRAIENAPNNKFTWDYAAWAAVYLGQRELAVKYWREALRRGHLLAGEYIKRYSPRI